MEKQPGYTLQTDRTGKYTCQGTKKACRLDFPREPVANEVIRHITYTSRENESLDKCSKHEVDTNERQDSNNKPK